MSGNIIEVCTLFFNYKPNDQASIIWHEIYHIEHGINQNTTNSNITISLPKPPENILEGINRYIVWENQGITPDIMDFVVEDRLNEFLTEKNVKDIQWYKNEVEAYVAEKDNGISKSDLYEGLINFMHWKYENIIESLNK